MKTDIRLRFPKYDSKVSIIDYKSNALVFAFYIGSKESFDEALSLIKRRSKRPFGLIGIGSDLENREVDRNEAETVARQIDAVFYLEISTKTKENIKRLKTILKKEFGRMRNNDDDTPEIFYACLLGSKECIRKFQKYTELNKKEGNGNFDINLKCGKKTLKIHFNYLGTPFERQFLLSREIVIICFDILSELYFNDAKLLWEKCSQSNENENKTSQIIFVGILSRDSPTSIYYIDEFLKENKGAIMITAMIESLEDVQKLYTDVAKIFFEI